MVSRPVKGPKSEKQEKTMIFLGLYVAKVIGMNVRPREPVPPVTNIVEFLSMILFFLLQGLFTVHS